MRVCESERAGGGGEGGGNSSALENLQEEQNGGVQRRGKAVESVSVRRLGRREIQGNCDCVNARRRLIPALSLASTAPRCTEEV